ncbi:MAG: TlpA disulfide reductase family protein [Agriterribacter sp.]
MNYYKKTILYFCNIILPAILFAQQTKIVGNIQGFSQAKIYLNIYKDSTITRDSAFVVNGHFTFTVSEQNILAARLVTKDISKKIYDKANNFYYPALQLLFYIEPNKNINIEGDYLDWPVVRIRGGQNNLLISEYYNSNKFGILGARKAMADAFMKKNIGDSIGFVKKDSIYLEMEQANNSKFNIFMDRNPNTILSAFAIYEQLPFINDEQKLKGSYSKFAGLNRFHPYVKLIQQRLTNLQQSAVGTIVKPFSVMGKDSVINIEFFRGKYVLLDFWGSWCAPCRQSHPHLKELYEKYKDKGFEIISIAFEKNENDRESWLAAIKKDSLPWIHILSNEVKKKNNVDLLSLFAIQSYPTKILVDKEGKIILKPQYGTDELDKMLENCFFQ